MSDKIEGVISNGQYRDTGSIGYTTLIKDKQNKIHSIEN